jgi:hypothetical protein
MWTTVQRSAATCGASAVFRQLQHHVSPAASLHGRAALRAMLWVRGPCCQARTWALSGHSDHNSVECPDQVVLGHPAMLLAALWLVLCCTARARIRCECARLCFTCRYINCHCAFRPPTWECSLCGHTNQISQLWRQRCVRHLSHLSHIYTYIPSQASAKTSVTVFIELICAALCALYVPTIVQGQASKQASNQAGRQASKRQSDL